MRKIIWGIIAAVMLIIICPVCVVYSTNVYFNYAEIDDTTIAITSYNGWESNVEIPSQIDGKIVTAIGEYAFAGNSYLEKIVIPDTVLNVYMNAFKDCVALTEVDAPSVIYFGEDAFENTKWLNDKLENNKFAVENNVLIKAQKNVTDKDSLSDDLIAIGGGAFKNCKNIKNFVVPEGIKYIEEAAFYNCDTLENISFPQSLVLIYEYAFSGCTSLCDAVLPQFLQGIGYGAFVDCTALREISIPYSVTQIMPYSFGYCYENTDLVKIKDVQIYAIDGTAGEDYINENGFTADEIQTQTVTDKSDTKNKTTEITTAKKQSTKITAKKFSVKYVVLGLICFIVLAGSILMIADSKRKDGKRKE